MFAYLMVFNATFNNMSVISWLSVLLVEETGGPRKNHRPVVSHWQTLAHNVVNLALIEIRTHNISGNKITDIGQWYSIALHSFLYFYQILTTLVKLNIMSEVEHNN